MDVSAETTGFTELDAGLHVIFLAEGAELSPALAETPGASDAKSGFKKLTVACEGERRIAIVGLGKSGELTPERLRIAGALIAAEAGRREATSIVVDLEPLEGSSVELPDASAALAEGTILGSYRFDRFRSTDPDDPTPPALESLVFAGASGAEAFESSLARARISAEAQN
ncbi:MAG TPA: M17 family peptidase N-terminal domain-containing protein, partial [Solirubrobacterales bacterium]|nr:M17 family peptidase N-terminal domain-containing protein [Solirubrobacterales bacterium]